LLKVSAATSRNCFNLYTCHDVQLAKPLHSQLSSKQLLSTKSIALAFTAALPFAGRHAHRRLRRRFRGGASKSKNGIACRCVHAAVADVEHDVHADVLSGPFKFGQLTLGSRLLLAPLESVSDCAYRRLCHSLGAGFTWTEMVRANPLARKNKATARLIDTFDPLTPTGVQLLTTKPKELRDALNLLDKWSLEGYSHWKQGIRGIDLNFGCPSPDVVGHGAGPAMLQRGKRMRELFDVLAEWRDQTSLRIGVIGAKIRLGMNELQERDEVFLRIVETAKGRLDYLTVHARNAANESTVPARWQRIKAAKEVAGDDLLILGNGDVYTRSDAERMVAETGCDGVVIARGAIRSAGLVFNKDWNGDGVALARASELEDYYGELVGRFTAREQRRMGTASPRQKYADYHREAFRRIRNRVGNTEDWGLMSG